MSELVDTASSATIAAKYWLLNTLAHVPDDKLEWTPSPTSKSALRIAAHVGVSNMGIISLLRGEKSKIESVQDYLAVAEAKEKEIKTREQAAKLIEWSTNFLVTKFDSMDEEALAGRIASPLGEMPAAEFLFFPSRHMCAHASQIDYLQTIWGDGENYY
jgi:uncharacterized damage-inducible protein DinB